MFNLYISYIYIFPYGLESPGSNRISSGMSYMYISFHFQVTLTELLIFPLHAKSKTIQGGPLLVINGVITPINGLING